MTRTFLPKLALALLAGGLLGIVLGISSLQAAVLFALFFLLGLVAYFQRRFEQVVWLFALAAAAVFGFFLTRQAAEFEESRWAMLYGPVENLTVWVMSDPYLERRAIVELVDPPHTGLHMSLTLDALPARPVYRAVLKISGMAHGRRLVPHTLEPFEGPVPALQPMEQFYFWCFKARDWVDHAMQRSTGQSPDFLAFARAELFGKRTDLKPEHLRILQDNGLTHIIAVSGMHTSLLAAVLFFFLAPALGAESGAALTIAAVWCFCVMVGAQPPVIRASICTTLALLGACLNRRVQPLTLLAAAFVTEFLLFPDHLRNAGFQLSYLAALGIALSVSAIKSASAEEPGPANDAPGGAPKPLPLGRQGWVRILLPLLMIQVFTAPLCAHLFYRWSALSIVSNLLFLPVFTFLIGLAAGGAALSPVLPAAAGWMFWIGDVTLRVCLKILAALPEFFSVSSNFGELPLGFLAAFLACWVLFLVWIPGYGRARVQAILLGSCAFLACLSLFPFVRNVAPPFCVIVGGDRAPYVVLKEGRVIHYAYVHVPQSTPPDVLKPFVRKFVRDGVKRIDRLDAARSVRDFLAVEFEVGDASAHAALPLKGLDRLDGGGFRFRREDMTVMYWTPRTREVPEASPARADWIVLEPYGGGAVPLQADLRADRAYVCGRIDPSKWRDMASKFKSIGVRDVFSAQVDGAVKVCQDRRRQWSFVSELQEALE